MQIVALPHVSVTTVEDVKRIKPVLLRSLGKPPLASIISAGWVEFKGLWYTLGREVSPDEFAARSFSGASFNRVRTRERISSGALVR